MYLPPDRPRPRSGFRFGRRSRGLSGLGLDPATAATIAQAAPAVLNLFKKKKGHNPGEGAFVGFAHSAVDQNRLKTDPYYLEAALRAEASHQRSFGVTWNQETSPVWAIQRDIQAQLDALKAEGWKPPEEPPVLPAAAAIPAPAPAPVRAVAQAARTYYTRSAPPPQQPYYDDYDDEPPPRRRRVTAAGFGGGELGKYAPLAIAASVPLLLFMVMNKDNRRR